MCADGPQEAGWRAVLEYGKPIYQTHTIPGQERAADDRWLVWIAFRKGIFVFISKPWGEPGAVEQNAGSRAWHGECMLKLAEWFP